MKVVSILEISGRFRAASMNFWVFSARNAISFPERSSKINVTPPDVPTPGWRAAETGKPWPQAAQPVVR